MVRLQSCMFFFATQALWLETGVEVPQGDLQTEPYPG